MALQALQGTGEEQWPESRPLAPERQAVTPEQGGQARKWEARVKRVAGVDAGGNWQVSLPGLQVADG